MPLFVFVDASCVAYSKALTTTRPAYMSVRRWTYKVYKLTYIHTRGQTERRFVV